MNSQEITVNVPMSRYEELLTIEKLAKENLKIVSTVSSFMGATCIFSEDEYVKTLIDKISDHNKCLSEANERADRAEIQLKINNMSEVSALDKFLNLFNKTK